MTDASARPASAPQNAEITRHNERLTVNDSGLLQQELELRAFRVATAECAGAQRFERAKVGRQQGSENRPTKTADHRSKKKWQHERTTIPLFLHNDMALDSVDSPFDSARQKRRPILLNGQKPGSFRPKPFNFIEFPQILIENVHDDVVVVEHDPPRGWRSFDALGPDILFAQFFLQLFGDGSQLSLVFPGTDHEEIGKRGELPDIEHHGVRRGSLRQNIGDVQGQLAGKIVGGNGGFESGFGQMFDPVVQRNR